MITVAIPETIQRGFSRMRVNYWNNNNADDSDTDGERLYIFFPTHNAFKQPQFSVSNYVLKRNATCYRKLLRNMLFYRGGSDN